jgi:type IV secretion system protein VirB10
MKDSSGIQGERTMAVVARRVSVAMRMQQRLWIVFFMLSALATLGLYYVSAAHRNPSKGISQAQPSASRAETALPPFPLESSPTALFGLVRTARADEPSNPGILHDADSDAMDAPTVIAAPPMKTGSAVESPVAIRATAWSTHTDTSTSSAQIEQEGEAERGEAVTNNVRATSSPRKSTNTIGGPFIVQAQRRDGLRFILPKGSTLDCTLETAIDSTLVGMTTCVLAADVFGADGRIVLLERGTRLVGEMSGELRAGQARVAILWNEARTPTGVLVPLVSPGTDALGRSGVTGDVDTHAKARFGAAVMLSLLDGTMTAIAGRQQSAGALFYTAPGSRDIATEVLHNTLHIPPTLRVNPGTRIQVMVARDIDFQTVYRLIARDPS